MPDAAERLPSAPPSFPHIPYYAIGCTLERIEGESDGRMQVDVIGQSALGRDMYGVVMNELETVQQRRDYRNWLEVREIALKRPATAQRVLRSFGDDVRMPVYIQGGIHGNEYQGVDAAMLLIEKLATTLTGRTSSSTTCWTT